ncbi:hypothetical protein QFZ53_002753 [Microbacterium natoriense]|uniref:Uncharacterized protein n=1 Tax=Microbacterium natoriense TaxID=284570 RepID=A0AAW8F1Y8_9MICO|nr:hypothetical protein [Microbacterium natoriense]
MSTTSAETPSAVASSRPTWATSRECVSRLRAKSAVLGGAQHLRLGGQTTQGRRVEHARAIAREVISLGSVRLGEVALGVARVVAVGPLGG